MALPKGKISKARKHARRANWKLTVPAIVKCEHCGAARAPHHVCKACGYYNGKQVLVVDEEAKEA